MKGADDYEYKYDDNAEAKAAQSEAAGQRLVGASRLDTIIASLNMLHEFWHRPTKVQSASRPFWWTNVPI